MAKFTDEQLLNFMNDNDQLLNDVASGKVDVQSVTKDKLKLGSLEAGWGEVLSSIPGQAGRQLQSQGAGVAQMALEDGGSLVDTGDGVSGAITRGLSPDANPFAPLTRAVKTIFGNDVVDKSAESVADYRADIQERMRQERPFIPETMSPKGIMYEGTTGVLPSAAAGVTTYALTRNPQLAAVASGLPSVGDYYGQGRDDNLTPNEASKRASVLGGLELATGQVPIVRALEPTAGTGLVKGLGKAYAEEGIQEAVTQAAELGYDATMHDKNISFADAARQIRDAGVIGGFGGAFMHGAGRGINKIAPKGQPKTDENQPVQSTGEVSQEANDLTQTPVEPNLDQPAYMRSGVFDPESMRLTGEDMPVSTAKTPEQLIQEQMAGGNAGMTPQELSSQNALYEAEQLRQEREALNQQLSDQRQQQYEQAVSQRDAQQEEEAKKPLYTQQNAPVGLNEQQQVDFYRDRDRQFGSLGNAELGQTPKNEAKNIKKRLAQQGSIEATPYGQQPKPEVEQFGIQQNPAMSEAFQQAQGNTNVIQKQEKVEQPKPKTKAEKRNETAVALDVAKKKSGESTTQFEERLDKVSEIYKDISSRQENGTFEDLSRDELADIAKQVGAKVLKKDTRASLRTRVSNWHGSVETKRNARQAQRTAAEEVGTLINNNADVPLEKLKEWQKNYNEANRTKAKTQVDTSVPDVYSGGDVEISLALGLDKVPAPDSQTRKDNPAFRDMDELMKASDGGDINKYIEDAGIRDQVEDYLVAVENNINPTDRDGGITEALGLPKDSNVKRLVAESIFSRKNDILEKADQKILSSMRTRRDTTNRDKAEETKVSAGIIKANRERETEAMGKARSLPLNEALDAVGTYEHTSVPNVTNMLMRKGLTEQEAIDRAKRIKQRGMIDSLVADKVGLKESEELKRQWDDQDFSRDPVEQTKEFLASREQEGNTDVVPMQEYEWAMPNGDESDIVRYNQESGEFERKYGDNSWSEINKRQAKRFLKDVGLNSPEGYGVKSANRSVVEETDESLAAQAEAERKYTAQIEKKQKQSANRKKREIKKKQESDQVGLFNNADKAMDYARQWELTETHYPDVEGESVRRQNAKDWTLRKMPTDKLPNGYIATMFRDPVGKWGDRYFITGDNLKALEPYAAQHWGGKNYKFQLAPKWATDRGVDLAKGEKVLNVPRDSKFLVKLQDAGAYIDTDDYSAMDALDTEQKGKTQESPNFTGTDLQEAARLTVSGYRLAEQNMEVWKHQRWLGELDSNLNRVVRERGVEGNFSQNDLGKTIGVTTENMQELRKVIESEGTQGDVVLARKLFPETARKRDAGEKIQLKPYFPQYIPKTERPNTPEIGDAMVVVSANNPRGVKRKYSTADRFYVESFDGDVVTAVSRFDNDKIKLKKASETTWNVVSRSENLKVVARLDKASPTLETSRKDLRKRWMAENSTESNTNVLQSKPKTYGKENKVFTEDAAAKAKALLKSKLGTVHSGIDPEIIQAGITLAGYHIEAGARKFSDYARAMINDLGDGSKPFLRSWYEGVRYYPNFDSKGMSSAAEIDAINVDELGGEDVPSTELDTERDSGNAEQEVREPAVSEPVQAERGRKTESVVDSTRTALEKRDERQSRNSVSENQPDSDGAGSDSKLHNDDGTTGIKSSVTRPNQSERSDGTDGQRNVVKSDGETATSSSTDRPVPSREERVRLQKEAESKSTKEGDLENIRETLPILLPEQQEDVHFAEKRFSEKGHGVHFANGTGTGKTFSGLGIVKRHQREGKNNILVVTPSNEINKEWFNAAPLFNMDIKALESKSDAGEGVVITTYANFRDNWELGKRDWDLLVMDESHNLLQKDSTEPTSALATLRALSGHPKGINRLNSLLNPEVGKPYEEYKAKYDKNVKEIDALEAIKVLSKIEKEKLADLKRANISLKEKMEPLAQELYKKLPETRKVAEKRWDKNQTNTVMLSATPWSYRKSVSLSEGFLFDYPDIETSGAYNSANSEQQFFIDTFGYQMKHNKLNEPDAKVDTGFLEREFNEKLKEDGSLRARVLEVEYDYDRKFELVDGGIGSKIDDGFAYLRQKQRDLSKAIDGDKVGTEEHTAALARKKAFDKLYNRIVTDFDYQQQIYLLEAIKAKAAVPYIKEHLDRGRKVVVFHGYNKGLEPNVDTGKGVQYRPFYVNEASELDPEILSAWNELKEDRPDMAELAIDDLTKPIDTLSKAFGDKAAFVNGIVSKKVAQKGISDFNKDGSGTDVIVVQQDKGSAGISLHDKTGKHQRVLINLGIPVKPTQSIQIEGRIYRVNLMSDALFRYFNTGLNFERRMFASRMATRAGTTENLAMGNSARALKDNMIEAFEDSQSWGVGFDGEGVGGKSADRQSNTDVTQWDRAKSLYYTQQKKTSATKAQEGKDYFATPEPVGLKMVEWLGLNKGDKVLEPSAGHGAISRWFPDGVFGHVVEPSNYLFPKAQMATNNLDKAHNIEFEEFGTNNKFNGIAMNPPYGKGGKVAMEHLSKAFQHLRRGGRVVALVPEGPAFQKRFDAWIEGQPTANHVATIHLPDSTFKRAGTSVSTKIVAIDYIPKGIPKEQSHHDVDLTSEKDVDDLFNRIEEMEIPPRQEIADIDVDEVMSDANLEVKKRRASKNTPAVWAVTGSGTYRYKEAIKASSAIEDKKPRFNSAKRSWDFAEENGNPSEAIAENVLKLQRGELDVSYSVTNELPSRSIDPRAAKLEVNKFLKKYRGAAGVKVRVVKTQNEVGGLPPRVQKLVQAAYNHSTGEVTIIAENIKSNRQLQQILRHEVIAHHGLQNLMSEKDFDQFLTDVIASNHPVIRSAWDEVNGRYPNESTKHKAEEVIALLAERQPKGITNVIQRALTTLTKWLRKVGLARADLTSGEVFNVLDGIEKGFQSGTPTYNRTRSGVSFSASSSNSGITSEKDLDQVFAPVHEQSPLKDRVSDWWDKFRASFRQKTVDRYDALKKLDREVMHDGDEMSDVTRSSWVLAKMAGAANGVIEATMGYGRMRYDAADKSFKPVSENDASGGFIGFMQSIGDKNEINAFLRWVAGERANQINKKADKAAAQASKTRQKIAEIDNAIDTLAWDKSNHEQSLMLREIKMQRKELAASLKDLEKKASVRERFLREQDIAGALALIEKGDRRERFQKHYETFKAYQNDFVDAGVATGVISKDAADMWRDEFYMPFYRVMKEDNETGAPVRPSGLSRQEAYKRFKGANIQVGDLLNNVIQNFSAITSASLKNQAAVQAMDNAMEAGVASETTESKRNKKASTWVMRDGKKVWYNVDDPLLFDAISSLDPVQLNFFGFKTAAKFKSAFTDIVTLSPKFILRNYIRDVFQTQATSTDVTLKSIYDSAKYVFNDIGKMNHEKALMLSTGASFTFAGNYAETSIDDVSGTANSLKKINSPEDAKKFAGKALEGYRALANNVENANRSAVFKAAKEAGKSDLEAAFNARDLMDFGSHGSNTTIRALVSIVPFLNARIQGLDKLSRTNGLYNAIAMKTPNATEKQLAKRFWLVSGLLISATIALYAVNVGDPENEEEYRKLTNEQRDLNWYVGGFLIPKPHEIGAFFITPAERMMDELVYDRAEDGALRNYASRTFLNTFSFNPTPQIVKPMVELYMNKNMFTDRPIEMEWEQGNSKRSIYDHRTSSIAKGSAEAMAMVFGDSFLSPKQIDHLIYGYTGWIGKTASDMVDMAVNEASDNPKPATYFGENPVVKAFVGGLYVDPNKPRYTQDQKRLYDLTQDIHRDFKDYQELIKLGNEEQAREMVIKKGQRLRLHKFALKANRNISKLNLRKKAIRQSTTLTAKQKREQIDHIQYVQSQISKNAIKVLNAAGIK